jgi:hypothetical protein
MHGKEEESVYEKSKVSSSTFHIVTESPVATISEMLILFLKFMPAAEMKYDTFDQSGKCIIYGSRERPLCVFAF